MTVRTVTEYFRRELDAAGYDLDDIGWSLGYCQGDGMDFAGRVGRDGVIRLYTRLMGGISEVWEALSSGEVSVEVTRTSSYYHHYNTMAVSVEWDEEHLREAYDFTEQQLSRLEDFRSRVEEDVRDVSRRLQKEGYAILEACSPLWFPMSRHWASGTLGDRAYQMRSFARGSFTVDVTMVENDHLDGYESGDGEADHADVKRMARGEIVSYDLRVRILEDGDKVYEEWAHGVTDKRSEIRPMTIARELLAAARSAMADKAARLARFAGGSRCGKGDGAHQPSGSLAR